MEYLPLDKIPHFSECEPLVRGMGFVLVDLKIIPQKTVVRISAVIACKDAGASLGVDECSKVHRALLPRIQALLGTDQTYMELTSPGTDRNIKNAAEFALFEGREIRVWDRNVSDWISGKILRSDESAVVLEVDGQEKEFRFEEIAKAKFCD